MAPRAPSPGRRPPADPPSDGAVDTETLLSTHESERQPGGGDHGPALVVVLSGSNPRAGSVVIPLRGVSRVDVSRATNAELSVSRRTDGSALLSLPDPKVSTNHASLDVRAAGLVVHDHGSRNGTFVARQRVEAPATAAPAVPILIGRTLLVFLRRAAPPDRDPWPFPTANARLSDELSRLARIAPTALPVLLLGETGVGKEVVARGIHALSGRSGPFVAVNCGALPTGLVEAQLFGHKRGAFSGAIGDALGFFRAAHEGTLFLDEIGDLPLSAQPALLRALQEGEVIPVGAVTPHKVDVRVLAATHKPLDRLVTNELFRADLYGRLRGFAATIPPLRDRREDLGHLVAKVFDDKHIDAKLAGDAVEALYDRPFPLNVRELSNVLVAAAYLADGGTIRAEHLARQGDDAGESRLPAPVPPATPLDAASVALRDELVRRLAETGGNVSQVARDMGKARQQIQRWMRRFGLHER